MLGFIGMGNMNGAIARGVVASGIDPREIVFSVPDPDHGRSLQRQFGFTYVFTNAEVASALEPGDVLILGVKPHLITRVAAEVATEASDLLVVSIAAGISIATIEAALLAGTAVVRALPNIPVNIRQGITALSPNVAATDEQIGRVEELFSALGETIRLDEKKIASFSAIASCSPAWTFSYIDALSRAGLAAGLTKDESLRIALSAVKGAAAYATDMLDEEKPASLVDRVTSPGGTTIAGLIAMEKAGFSAAVITGVEAAMKRDSELG